MPPRIPTRAFTTLPFGPNSVASSSTLPPPPRPSSPEQSTRSIHTGGLYNSPTYPLERCNRRRLSDPRLRQQSRSFHASAPSNASAKDPYEVLGVKKGDSAGDIKKVYYQLAKKWHPDSNKEKGANERFMEIQAAYDILSDDKKRQAYDTYGSASTQEGFDPNFGRGAGGFGGFQGFGGGFGGQAGNAGDLFEQLFGGAFGGGGGGGPFGSGGGQRQRPSKGDDLETIITLSFLEACNGVSRKLTITPVVDCKPCTGSGLKPGQKKSQCTTCRGTGQQTFQVQGMYMASTCQSCGGAGSTIPRGARCGECEGVGKVKERKEIDVDIPAGVEDGMKVKMPGMGDMPLGSSGSPGDLLIRVNVKPSAVFRRQGTNLYHDAKVPLHTALLGGRIRIPTLEGDVEVRVREGTQNGEEAVLKGRGVRSVYPQRGREARGDLVVGWRIQIPRSLTGVQKKIMQAYADDVEGRTPNITFGSPAPSPSLSESATAPLETPSSSQPQSPPSSNKDTSSEKGKSPSSAPFVETEPRPSPDQPSVLDNIASAVGGALGWAESLFGGGRDKGKGSGRLVVPSSTSQSASSTAPDVSSTSPIQERVDDSQPSTRPSAAASGLEAEVVGGEKEAEVEEVEEEKKAATG